MKQEVSRVLPDALLTRFRGVAFERLERIDARWMALTRGNATPKAEEDLFQELRRLNGDARVIGFPDAAVLCQRLEDLVAAAKQRQYRVNDDVDIVMTMAIQFLGMLLRSRGEADAGIDFDGFLGQIERVLGEWRAPGSKAQPEHGPRSGADAARDDTQDGTVSGLAARRAIAVAATTAYMEHLRASGRSRERLRGVWEVLSREVTAIGASAVGPLLARHAAAAREVARQLGKSAEVSADAEDLQVTEAVFDAVNTALFHLTRNAVEYGVEDPAVRARAGKPASATIRMRASRRGSGIEVEISDDGPGIDYGLSSPPSGAKGTASRPGVGPGVGLEAGLGLGAVRAEIGRFGGEVHVESRIGAGTTVRLTVPNRLATVELLVFRAAGATSALAVDATWTVDRRPPGDRVVRHPLDLLEIPRRAQLCAEHILHLQRGSKRCAFWTDGPSRRATAVRVCPTPEDSPVEVLKIAGEDGEVMLLRPDALDAPHPSVA